MSKLCIYLPPFSSDYVGVCSALFELGGLLVIHDAAGCTGNFTGYEEPRWYDSKALLYCSRLRELDAVLGQDDKHINKIVEAAKELKPRFIALMGSPVPMLIGADLKGIATQIEGLTGIPTFGFNTTGLNNYVKGTNEAYIQLIKRFAVEPVERKAKRVNVLGLTPLDFSINHNVKNILTFLETKGFEIGVNLSMSTNKEISIDDIKTIGEASLNIVASVAGLETAKYLEKTFGTKYITGIPIGDGETFFLPDEKEKIGDIDTLIIHDQIIANSIRKNCANKERIAVASCFKLEPELAKDCDILLKDEASIIKEINKGYKTIIADPLILELVKDETVTCIPLTHLAISSKIYWDQYTEFKNFNCNIT